MDSIEVVTNDLGSCDWFKIYINGKFCTEGHTIGKHELVEVLATIGHSVKYKDMTDTELEEYEAGQ